MHIHLLTPPSKLFLIYSIWALSATQVGATFVRNNVRKLLLRSASRANTVSFARSASGGFQGTWEKQTQSFSWSLQNDFMLTWDLPVSGKRMNITASDAVQANGPLTLLHVIGMCRTGALASLLDKARESKKVSLHLVGVNSSLEPGMEWDRFLMGPLLEKHRRLVEAFNLPVTPFAGMTVSLLFSGTNRTSDKMQEVRRFGPFVEGYSESFVSGLYHVVVDEVPDLVLAINPGFALYPSAWWPTLNKLHFLQVPIIATGYSGAFSANRASNIGTVYEHHRSIHPELEGRDLHLHRTPCRTLRGCLRSWSSQGKITVHHLNSDSSTLPSPQQCASELGTSEVSSVCGDLDGNAFLANKAGYKVRLSSQQPFAYCDDPARHYCQSSAVVSVFEPDGIISESSLYEYQDVPAKVLRDDLNKLMRCHPQMHSRTRRCMEGYIQEQSGEKLRQEFVLTQVLNSALGYCNSFWDDV